MADKNPISVSDKTDISMPVRNLLSIVIAVCIGVWSYFGIVERLNRLETFEKLIQIRTASSRWRTIYAYRAFRKTS